MGGVPFTMEIELGKIREFAYATKSNNPDYFTAEHPVSPATFLMTASFWAGGDDIPWEDADVEFDQNRLLHGGQEFVFYGEPPRAGTRLVGQSRVVATYTKQGKRGEPLHFTEVVKTFRTTDGRLVAEAKSIMIITGQPPTATSDGAARP